MYVHMLLSVIESTSICWAFFFADEPRSTHTACSEERRNSVIEHTLEWGVNPGGGTREYYLGLRVTTDGDYPRLRRFLRKLQLLVFCTFQFRIRIQFFFPFLYCTFVLQACRLFANDSFIVPVLLQFSTFYTNQIIMQFSSMIVSFLIHT